MLVDKRYQDLNMEEISDLVGFSNRQSFYASFFKLNGVTPRDYRKKRLLAMPSQDAKPKKRGRKAGGKNKPKAQQEE